MPFGGRVILNLHTATKIQYERIKNVMSIHLGILLIFVYVIWRGTKLCLHPTTYI